VNRRPENAMLKPELVAGAAAPLPADQIFTPGIRRDLSNANYQRIDALSATGIRRLLQSPLHHRFAYLHPDQAEASSAQKMGSALHLGILEPDRFDSGDVVTIPADAPSRPSERTLKAAKPSASSLFAMDYWRDFDELTAGKILLTAAESEIVQGMVESVRAHPLYRELFSGGAGEVSYQWRDARLGIPCRCRFDYLQGESLAVDLKSTRDASPEGFAKAAASYAYGIQQAHYLNGFEHLHDKSLDGFVFFAVENVAPYCCAAYVLPSNVINFCLDRVEQAMLLYKRCRDTGEWPGYSQRILPLTLPRWATTMPPVYE
jgi:hypothetical protein